MSANSLCKAAALRHLAWCGLLFLIAGKCEAVEFQFDSSRVQVQPPASSFAMTGTLTGHAPGIYRFALAKQTLANLKLKINNIVIGNGAPVSIPGQQVQLMITGDLAANAPVGQAIWVDLTVSNVLGQRVAEASFYAKLWDGGAMPGEIHAVNLAPTAVIGGQNGQLPMLVVTLDGPAKAGGQEVLISSTDSGVAWTLTSKNTFTIPAGATQGMASAFLETKKVSLNKSIQLTATVNGRVGYTPLGVRK